MGWDRMGNRGGGGKDRSRGGRAGGRADGGRSERRGVNGELSNNKEAKPVPQLPLVSMGFRVRRTLVSQREARRRCFRKDLRYLMWTLGNTTLR
ncbi:hypothetical protein LX36DRAFT_398910 [Colletotrichum falcatum]|nr:hypothetical protein LX36DRAFT_398910 [Colletotrichum falcatum]